ncbi:DUF3800 domain-containing protein [Oceanithermus sp.]
MSPSHVVFLDESGDHGLLTYNPTYPIFVLSAVIFTLDEYIDHVVPIFQRLKYDFFGHDQVILHERDIRKSIGPFSSLSKNGRKEEFLKAISSIMADSPMKIIGAVIKKDELAKQYAYPDNPYELGLKFILERINLEIGPNNISVVIESRGKKEDSELELAFRRICDGDNYSNTYLNYTPIFASKLSNTIGLQIADLIARPIGLSVLKPEQDNQAFEIIKTKLRRSPSGKYWGWGLKVFP